MHVLFVLKTLGERDGRVHTMQEVAEASASTFAQIVLSATGFSEICDGGEFGAEGSTGIPSVIERVYGELSLVFPIESRINVADEMVSDIVTDVQLKEVAILDHWGLSISHFELCIADEALTFAVHILKELVKMSLLLSAEAQIAESAAGPRSRGSYTHSWLRLAPSFL